MSAPGYDPRLFALPVHDPNRPKLRDRVPLSGDALARRASKFCTPRPSELWRAQPVAPWTIVPKGPKYPSWTIYRVPSCVREARHFSGLCAGMSIVDYVRAFESNADLAPHDRVVEPLPLVVKAAPAPPVESAAPDIPTTALVVCCVVPCLSCATPDTPTSQTELPRSSRSGGHRETHLV